MPRPLTLRGVIEGFYGTPWSHEARLGAISFLGARDMNAYVYAPKSDPLHREEWRTPYPEVEVARFRELAAACTREHMRFGFAISPGLDIAYESDADRAALLAKLSPLVEAGVDWVVLALDDIPNRPGLAAEQASLTTHLHDTLGAEVRLSLVPTEYVGTRPSPYLAQLDAGLPAAIDVFWTGPTVCSPTITTSDAHAWRAAIGGRPLLLWDNFPVNDSVMERELHLGPYRGRDTDLGGVIDGVLCNPMIQPTASLVPLATAAEFLADPEHYDEHAAWDRAIDAVGAAHRDALRALARACCDGPLARPEDLPLHGLVRALEDELEGPGWSAPLARVRDDLRALRAAATAWDDAPDDPLRVELAPWLLQARAEAEAGLAALRLLQQVRPVAAIDAAGAGRAAAPDAELALQQCFALLFVWAGAREASHQIVLGPRFGLHAAVVQLADGRPALDVTLALREDCSVTDRLARLALEHYERWTADTNATDATRALGVMVDGERISIEPDGRFRAPPGAMVLVRSGSYATRVTEPAPPLRDPRLT